MKKPFEGWTFIVNPPVILYANCLWPWWARWCGPMRRWYRKTHPERFDASRFLRFLQSGGNQV